MKVNQLKAGVMLSYVTLLLSNLINILYTPLMLRLLSQSEYGLFSLATTTIGYLGLLSFGFGSAYVRFYSMYKVGGEQESIDKLNGMFIAIFTALGALAVAAGAVLVFNTGAIFGANLTALEISQAKILMAVLVLNVATSFPLSVYTSYLTANERYLFQRTLNMVKMVAGPLLVIAVLLLGFKAVGMVVVTTAVNIIVGVIGAVHCHKKLGMRLRFSGFEKRVLKELTIFSSFIFANMIVDQVNWGVGTFLLGMFKGTAASAVFGVATRLNSFYLSFAATISSVFIPRVNRLVAQRDDKRELTGLFTRVGRVQFIVSSLVCTGLVFFGRPFLYYFAGAEYRDSYASIYIISLLLIIPVTIPLIQNLGIEIQRAKNMHKFRSILYLGIAVVNIVISIPLCKAYGGVGCAVGTAISLLVGNGIIMNIHYHKTTGLDMKHFWVQILKLFPALLLPAALGVYAMLRVDLFQVRNLLLGIVVYAAVFCASMWLLGMNAYEKDLIRKPIGKLVSKLRRAE